MQTNVQQQKADQWLPDVAGGETGRNGGSGSPRGTRKLLGMTDIFIISIVVMVSWV